MSKELDYIIHNETDLRGTKIRVDTGISNILHTVAQAPNKSIGLVTIEVPGASDNSILETSSLSIEGKFRAIFETNYLATGATGAGQKLDQFFPHSEFGLARNGMLRACTSFSSDFNGYSIIREPNQYFGPLSLFGDLTSADAPDYSAPDFANDYSKYLSTGSNVSPILNPLSDDNDMYQCRSNVVKKFLCDSLGNPVAGTTSRYAAVDFTQDFTVPAEFMATENGIRNVAKLNFKLQFMAQYFPQVFSMTPTVAGRIQGVDIQLREAMKCHHAFFTDKTYITEALKERNASGQLVAKDHDLHFNEYRYYESSHSTLPSGTSLRLTSVNISASSIPKAVCIFARRVINASSVSNQLSTPETYGIIKSLRFTYGTTNPHFTALDEDRLMRMSVKNGCLIKKNHFQEMGSLIMIDLSKDIGIQDFFIGQAQANSNMFVDAEVYNNLDKDETYQLCVVIQHGNKVLSLKHGGGYEIFDTVSLSGESKSEQLKRTQVSTSKSSSKVIGGGIGSALLGIGKGLLKSGPELMKIISNVSGGGMAPTIAGSIEAPPPLIERKTAGGIDNLSDKATAPSRL